MQLGRIQSCARNRSLLLLIAISLLNVVLADKSTTNDKQVEAVSFEAKKESSNAAKSNIGTQDSNPVKDTSAPTSGQETKLNAREQQKQHSPTSKSALELSNHVKKLDAYSAIAEKHGNLARDAVKDSSGKRRNQLFGGIQKASGELGDFFNLLGKDSSISRVLGPSVRSIMKSKYTAPVYVASALLGAVALMAFYESPLSPLPVASLPEPPVGRFPPESPNLPANFPVPFKDYRYYQQANLPSKRSENIAQYQQFPDLPSYLSLIGSKRQTIAQRKSSNEGGDSQGMKKAGIDVAGDLAAQILDLLSQHGLASQLLLPLAETKASGSGGSHLINKVRSMFSRGNGHDQYHRMSLMQALMKDTAQVTSYFSPTRKSSHSPVNYNSGFNKPASVQKSVVQPEKAQSDKTKATARMGHEEPVAAEIGRRRQEVHRLQDYVAQQNLYSQAHIMHPLDNVASSSYKQIVSNDKQSAPVADQIDTMYPPKSSPAHSLAEDHANSEQNQTNEPLTPQVRKARSVGLDYTIENGGSFSGMSHAQQVGKSSRAMQINNVVDLVSDYYMQNRLLFNFIMKHVGLSQAVPYVEQILGPVETSPLGN